MEVASLEPGWGASDMEGRGEAGALLLTLYKGAAGLELVEGVVPYVTCSESGKQ